MLPLMMLTALAAEPVLAPHEALTHPTAERVTIEGFLWNVVTECPPCPENARCEACLEPFDGVFLAPQRQPTERPMPGIRVEWESPRPDLIGLRDTLVRVTGDLQVSGMARWMEHGTVEVLDKTAEWVALRPDGEGIRVDLVPGTPPELTTDQLEQLAWYEASFRGIERARTAHGGGPGIHVATFYGAGDRQTGALNIGKLTGRVYD